MKQFLWRDYLSAIGLFFLDEYCINRHGKCVNYCGWFVTCRIFAPLGARRKHEKKSVTYFCYSGRQAKTQNFMTILSYFRFVGRREKTRKYDKVAKIRGAKIRHGMNQPPCYTCFPFYDTTAKLDTLYLIVEM
jgi:hypothetical protein